MKKVAPVLSSTACRREKTENMGKLNNLEKSLHPANLSITLFLWNEVNGRCASIHFCKDSNKRGGVTA